jgi:hypothetical protein
VLHGRGACLWFAAAAAPALRLARGCAGLRSRRAAVAVRRRRGRQRGVRR